ncbi:hypothetical protein FQZ97_1038640 [compost metagenome]
MGFPRQENDPVLAFFFACHLAQHALLAGLHQRPAFEAIALGVDHFLDVLVGGRTGFDAVDLLVKPVGEPGQVGEGFHPGVRHIGGHGQRELGAGQVGAHHFE